MEESIYQIAHKCKEISSEVQINVFVGNGHVRHQVTGKVSQFEKELLKLCDALQNKHTKVSTYLRNHISHYNNHPTFHQGAIEAILDCIINLDGCRKSNRKIFISHASADAPIINAFIKEILMLGCGLKSEDIFCTLDHTVIRTGDDFREQIVENMKSCDFILCFISEKYEKSQICQNEMGAAWAMDNKRILPFKFPNISFNEIGFLNVTKQAADITDNSKLDELYDELTEYYGLQQDWINYNQRKADFINTVHQNM
ncbi:MAG: toll/interleukin-1 receptor domain-containing protein [Muribaculaceae bacterium]|nr:toll/interleukin-1 receptor domain-containing protein [Muribaculaceae bacterium]